MRRWPLVLLFLFASADAWALKPDKHRSIAETSCKRVGLPYKFCESMGKVVYETDYYEWDDLSAHAQTPRGGDRCSAAQASVQRLDTLGRQLVAHARAQDLADAARDLGRALHTLQDECAHHGMTNEQHSYFSLEQTCGDQDVSPDIQPDAIACAQERTDDVMRLVAAQLAGTNWSGAPYLCEPTDNGDHGNSTDPCQQATLPTPFQACDFLALHDEWNGVDSTWNSTIVGRSLVYAFVGGMRGEAPAPSVCGGNAHAIDPVSPAPRVTAPSESCTLTDIGCFGKVDGADDNPNVDPYGDPFAPPPGAGCNAAGASGWLAALLALVLTSRKRR